MTKSLWKTLRKSGAFTLVELLVVVAILGILVTALLMILNPGRLQGRARDTRRKSDLGVVRTAVEMYYSDEGVYPDTGGIPFGSDWAVGEITYLRSVPQDPLSTQVYCYQQSGSGYLLCAQPEIAIEGGTTSTCEGASYGYCVTNPF